MKVIKTAIDGVLILEPRIFKDARGYFFESFSSREFEEKICKTTFVQDNESFSGYGVVRGLHFQKPPFTQSKIVRVIKVCRFIAALGGPENIAQLGNCFTRLRLTVRDASLLDMGALLSLPHKGLVVQGTRVQLVCGLHAAQLRHALEQQLAEMAPV